MMEDPGLGKVYPQGLYHGSVPLSEGPFRRLGSGSSPNRWAEQGPERLHAYTCSMIIAPAESLLGNVIHHPAAATCTDREGGGGGRDTVLL